MATSPAERPTRVSVEEGPTAFTFPDLCDGAVQLCDQAAEAGLHVLPAGHGRGAAVVDVDGDGWDDLFEAVDRGNDPDGRASTLWRNNADGTFSPLDLGIAPEHLGSNWAGIWGDIDNDGDPDLFLVNGGFGVAGPSRLYRNDLATTGSLTDVSEAAGIRLELRHWWGASFADYDNDGHLDLVVTAMAKVDSLDASWDGSTALYRNKGDGRFEEVSEAAGLVDPVGSTKNPTWLDYDSDGDLDLFLASLGGLPGDSGVGLPALFENDGAGGFRDATEDVLGDPLEFKPVFSAATADFDQNGTDDLYLGRWFAQDWILLFDRTGAWTRLDETGGLDMSLDHADVENTMGLSLGDIQADGWPDVFIGTGAPSGIGPALFYCHQGKQIRFERCAEGVFGAPPLVQNHGSASGDLDHDGDEDLFYNHGGSWSRDNTTGEDSTGASTLWVNHDGVRNTLAIRLVGTISNRDAVGARLAVNGSETRYYTVWNAQGFQSQNSRWRMVTLGEASQGTVRITWPSGTVHEIEVSAGTRVEVLE